MRTKPGSKIGIIYQQKLFTTGSPDYWARQTSDHYTNRGPFNGSITWFLYQTEYSIRDSESELFVEL